MYLRDKQNVYLYDYHLTCYGILTFLFAIRYLTKDIWGSLSSLDKFFKVPDLISNNINFSLVLKLIISPNKCCPCTDFWIHGEK